MKEKRKFIPYFLNFKLVLWSVIVLTSISLCATFIGDNLVTVNVKPTSATNFYDSTIVSFNENKVILSGVLEIPKPTLYEVIILPQEYAEFNFIRNLFILIGCIILLLILPEVKGETLFDTDISKLIFAIGILIIVYSFLEVTQNSLASSIIRTKTKGIFMLKKTNFFIPTFWIGVIVFWIGTAYKKAFNLKKEQDLTI